MVIPRRRDWWLVGLRLCGVTSVPGMRRVLDTFGDFWEAWIRRRYKCPIPMFSVSAENKGVRVSAVRRPEQSIAQGSFEDSGLVSLSDTRLSKSYGLAQGLQVENPETRASPAGPNSKNE
jgi:hypothetical protein